MNRFADLGTTQNQGTQNRFSDLGTATPKQNFQTTETTPVGLGGGYGASTLKDPYSGKPLLTYESEAQKSSLLLSDRTAPSLDITKPQKFDPSILKNKRMPQDASAAVKQKIGGTTAQELDHVMPLELGGSNTDKNLSLEAFQSGKKITATDPIENQIAHKVYNGEISVLDGWKQMAKAKGKTLPEDARAGVKPTYETGAGRDVLKAYPSTISGLAELQIDPLNIKANPHKAISEAVNNITDSIKQEGQNIKDLFGAKTLSEKIGAGLKTLAGGAGVALSPITALFAGANQIPVIGSISKLVSLPFDLMGDAGADTAKVVVDKLPISQQAKNNIVDGVGEIFSLAGQLAIGKIGADVMPRLKEKYGAKDAQTIISKAQEIAKQKTEAEKPVVSPDGKFQTTTEKPAGVKTMTDIVKPEVKAEVPKAEVKPAEVPVEKPLPTSLPSVREKGLLKTAGVGEKVVSKQATAQKMRDTYGLAPEEYKYQKLDVKTDIERAADFTNTNAEVAKKVAMGKETPPQGQTTTRIRDAVIAKAELEGDYETLSDVIGIKITAGTRMGQEIQAYADSTSNEFSAGAYMKQLIKDRYESSAKRYSSFMERAKIRKDGRAEKIVGDRIKEGTKTLSRALTEAKFVKAEDLLNSILCR